MHMLTETLYILLVCSAFIVCAFENILETHQQQPDPFIRISSMSSSSLESLPTRATKGKILLTGHVREGVGKLGSLCKGSRRVFKGRTRSNKVSRVGETHLIIFSRQEETVA